MEAEEFVRRDPASSGWRCARSTSDRGSASGAGEEGRLALLSRMGGAHGFAAVGVEELAEGDEAVSATPDPPGGRRRRARAGAPASRAPLCRRGDGDRRRPARTAPGMADRQHRRARSAAAGLRRLLRRNWPCPGRIERSKGSPTSGSARPAAATPRRGWRSTFSTSPRRSTARRWRSPSPAGSGRSAVSTPSRPCRSRSRGMRRMRENTSAGRRVLRGEPSASSRPSRPQTSNRKGWNPWRVRT